MTDIRDDVRARYGQAARAVAIHGASGGCGCGPDCCSTEPKAFGGGLYGDSAQDVPDEAVLASLGCGNPTAIADLNEGETVLDLGSGGGLDVILSARRVGPTGKAYGLDMTEEMLALALENKARAGADNVEFLKGYIEDIPLPANTVDAIVSNCVINLSPDKSKVFAEAFRVLRPGGRLTVTDVVAEERAMRGHDDVERWSACLAGALTRAEYEQGLITAGFEHVEILDSHGIGDGYTSAIIRAHKPAGSTPSQPLTERPAEAFAAPPRCC